jgi:hypothetical protein
MIAVVLVFIIFIQCAQCSELNPIHDRATRIENLTKSAILKDRLEAIEMLEDTSINSDVLISAIDALVRDKNVDVKRSLSDLLATLAEWPNFYSCTSIATREKMYYYVKTLASDSDSYTRDQAASAMFRLEIFFDRERRSGLYNGDIPRYFIENDVTEKLSYNGLYKAEIRSWVKRPDWQVLAIINQETGSVEIEGREPLFVFFIEWAPDTSSLLVRAKEGTATRESLIVHSSESWDTVDFLPPYQFDESNLRLISYSLKGGTADFLYDASGYKLEGRPNPVKRFRVSIDLKTGKEKAAYFE